jgi:hypothetical protein
MKVFVNDVDGYLGVALQSVQTADINWCGTTKGKNQASFLLSSVDVLQKVTKK